MTITLESSVVATSVSAPTVSSAPRRLGNPGRSSSASIVPLVASSPSRPNHPNGFCVPWPIKSGPTSPRIAAAPSAMRTLFSAARGDQAAVRPG